MNYFSNLPLVIALYLCLILSACENQPKNVDPCTEYDQVEKERLDLVASIETKFEKNGFFRKRFTMSQVYWIQYRNRHMRALYPQDWDRQYRKEHGEEVFNTCKCKELTRMTKARISELKMWIEGGPTDQQECPSTWNE